MTREEAIRRIKAWNLDSDDMEVLAVIVPELIESEDERIRQNILTKMRACQKQSNFFSNDEIAWFEKQKEQKELPFVKDVMLGYPGLYYYDGERMHFRGNPAMEEKQKEPHYTKRNALFDKCVENCDPEVMKEVSDKVDEMLAKEQKPIEEQDLSGLNDLERVIHRGFLCAGVENAPVTLIKETAQECLAQMQSTVWSDEDEEMLSSVEQWLHEVEPQYVEKELSWLECLPKRLNLQPHWKPSEEQMEELSKACRFIPYNCDILESLYKQLEKLGVKEEPEYYQHFDPDC